MMETLLTNAYTGLDKNAKLFETNSIATGMKELLQRKIYIKKHFSFFYKMAFWKKFINRMNGGYKMIWKLSYGD